MMTAACAAPEATPSQPRAFADGAIYFLSNEFGANRIRRISLLDSETTSLVSSRSQAPSGIALDVAEGKMYWADSWIGKILRANLDGGGIEEVVSCGWCNPSDVFLDTANDKMYWIDRTSRETPVFRANLDGSEEETVTKAMNIDAFTIDTAGSEMYWADYGGSIWRTGLDGGGDERLLTLREPRESSPDTREEFAIPDIDAITLDLANAKIYWTDNHFFTDAAHIRRANLDGSAVQDLVTFGEHNFLHGFALDRLNGKMYWTRSGAIQRSDLSGGAIENVMNVGAGSLALDAAGGKIYWTGHGPHKIRRANLNGGSVENLYTPAFSSATDIAIDQAGGKLYWSSWDNASIRRADLDGGGIEDLVNEDTVHSIALDADGGKMYWTTGRKVRRANLDGSHIEDLVRMDEDTAGGIAVDARNGKMYWTVDESDYAESGVITRFAPDRIHRANLDGSDEEILITMHLPHERSSSIAIDTADGKMYWLGLGSRRWFGLLPRKGEIWRANLDGADAESIVTLSGESELEGITLDVADGKVYWSDWDTGKIQRANLDGGDPEDVAEGLFATDIVFAPSR